MLCRKSSFEQIGSLTSIYSVVGPSNHLSYMDGPVLTTISRLYRIRGCKDIFRTTSHIEKNCDRVIVVSRLEQI